MPDFELASRSLEELKIQLEVLVDDVGILVEDNPRVNLYKTTCSHKEVRSAFAQLVSEGRVRDLYPLGTTQETVNPTNTYYVSVKF